MEQEIFDKLSKFRVKHIEREVSKDRYQRALNQHQENLDLDVNEVLDEPKSVRAELLKLKEEFDSENLISTKLSVSSEFVKRRVESDFGIMAYHSAARGDIASFIVHYDTLIGATSAMDLLQGAEGIGSEAIELEIAVSTNYTGGLFAGFSDFSIDLYLNLTREFNNASKILVSDPSGITVINEYIKQLRGEPNLIGSPDESSILEAQGAEVAREIYKKVYPQTQGII